MGDKKKTFKNRVRDMRAGLVPFFSPNAKVQIVAHSIISSGFSISPGASLGDIMVELERPENSKLGVTEVFSKLEKRGVMTSKNKDKEPKSSRSADIEKLIPKSLLKKLKGKTPVIFIGSSGVGKTEIIESLAKRFEEEAKKNKSYKPELGLKGQFFTFEELEARALKEFDSEAFKKAFRLSAPIKVLPLDAEQKKKIVHLMLKRGAIELSKGVSKAKVTAELRKPENNELSIRETLALLRKKGLLRPESKNKKPKGLKPG